MFLIKIMAKKKYIFNPQTLDYEEYKPSKSKKLRNVVFFILTAQDIVVSILMVHEMFCNRIAGFFADISQE